MYAGSVFVEYESLSDQENRILNTRIRSKGYMNACYSLYGTFDFDVVMPFNEKYDVSFLKTIVGREQKIKCYFRIPNSNYNFLLFKGVITNSSLDCDVKNLTITMQALHSTYRLKTEELPIYTTLQDMSCAGALKFILSQNNIAKCYERLILNQDTQKPLSIEIYSGNQENANSLIQSILSDMPARMFTTIIDNKVTLYVYDTGSLIDEKDLLANGRQKITNDQVESVSIRCDYTMLVDSISAQSENSIDEVINDSNYINNASNLLQHKSIGIKRFLSTNQLDLGALNKFENTTSPSDSQSLKEYTDAKIAEAIDSAFYLKVKVLSLLQDVTNPSKGIWQLGGRIDIENDICITLLKMHNLETYLNSDKYFFVVKHIEYTENSEEMCCNLYLTINDVLRFI